MSKQRNVASPKQIKQDKQEEARKQRERLGDLKTVMSTPEGRRVIWDIVNRLCHADATSVQGNSGSEVFFREGERNVGRRLKGDCYLVAFPEWQKMEKEYIDRLKLEELIGEKEDATKKKEQEDKDA